MTNTFSERRKYLKEVISSISNIDAILDQISVTDTTALKSYLKEYYYSSLHMCDPNSEVESSGEPSDLLELIELLDATKTKFKSYTRRYNKVSSTNY